MILNRQIRDQYGSIALTLIFVGLLAYFTYHAISGERGFFAMLALQDELTKSKNELDAIRADRINFEHKVALMRSDSLDLDLLDEQARKVLIYAAPSEEVYLYSAPDMNASH